MATISDVEQALVSFIGSVLYPNTTEFPGIIDAPCVVYSGWPVAKQLDDDLAAGKVNATVYPGAVEKNTTRYPMDWQEPANVTPSITAVVAGQTVALGGSVPSPFVPHAVAIVVNGVPYVYGVQQTDTLQSIATQLASLIAAGGINATSIGAVVTLPSSANIKAARVGTVGVGIRAIRQQQRQFQVSVWAPSPTLRDDVSNPIDIALTKLKFLPLSDGTAARIIYVRSAPLDDRQRANLYRLDLIYSVEYSTTEKQTFTQITQPGVSIALQVNGATGAVQNSTQYS